MFRKGKGGRQHACMSSGEKEFKKPSNLSPIGAQRKDELKSVSNTAELCEYKKRRRNEGRRKGERR